MSENTGMLMVGLFGAFAGFILAGVAGVILYDSAVAILGYQLLGAITGGAAGAGAVKVVEG